MSPNAHVVPDEGEDLRRVFVREAQPREDAFGDGYSGFDVAVEPDAVGLLARGGGLRGLVGGGFANVVEQRSPGQCRGRVVRKVLKQQQGVGPDIAFRVELRGLGDALKLLEFRQDVGEEASVGEELKASGGAAFGEDASEFSLNALGGDGVDVCCVGTDGGGCGGVDGEVETGREADGAQHAELVFGEAEDWVADGPDRPCGEVFASVDEVEQRGLRVVLGIGVEGDGVEQHPVDGEVAPEDIVFGRSGEADCIRTAAVGVGAVVAEGGHFGGDVRLAGLRGADEDDAEVRPGR